MNEKNEWDHRISAGVKEGATDCVKTNEVTAALKRMKKHKAPGLSGLAAEIIQAAGGCLNPVTSAGCTSCLLYTSDAADE